MIYVTLRLNARSEITWNISEGLANPNKPLYHLRIAPAKDTFHEVTLLGSAADFAYLQDRIQDMLEEGVDETLGEDSKEEVQEASHV